MSIYNKLRLLLSLLLYYYYLLLYYAILKIPIITAYFSIPSAGPPLLTVVTMNDPGLGN